MTRTELGVVVAKTKGHLTILLAAGNKVTVPIVSTSLALGNKCQVAFNSTTREVVRIFHHLEMSDINEAESPIEYYPSEEELKELELESSREPERWETGDWEYWSWRVLGNQEGENLEFGEFED